jgi:hypothetical protein
MTYAQLLDYLCSLSDRDLDRAAMVRIADQVLPLDL